MAKINPQDEKYDSTGKTPHCRPGEKLLAAVGFERYKASTGTPMIGVRFLCLHDYSGDRDDNDNQSIAFENFATSERALWRIVALARAVGYSEPFDPDDDADIEALLTHGYVKATLAEETYRNKTTVRISDYAEPGDYDEDPSWGQWIEQAEEDFRGYLDWRDKNPRGGSGSGSKGASGGGSKGVDDDLPF